MVLKKRHSFLLFDVSLTPWHVELINFRGVQKQQLYDCFEFGFLLFQLQTALPVGQLAQTGCEYVVGHHLLDLWIGFDLVLKHGVNCRSFAHFI